MNTQSLLAKIGFSVICATSYALLCSSSCASKITDEQKNQLSELRRQQASLGEKIKLKANEISRLESEIADRERAVAKCNEEKTALEQRLAKWPNAWPDYTEPAKDTTSAKKKTK